MRTLRLEVKTTVILFLAAFVLGLCIVARSHAEEAPLWQPAEAGGDFQQPHHTAPKSKSKHAKKPHSKKNLAKKPAKKKAAPKSAHARKAPAPQVAAQLHQYAHPMGLYQLRYPSGWQLNSNDTAMIVKSTHGDRAVFGIVRRPETETNEAAIEREFSANNRPADLTRASARVAGLPATKVIGSSKEDPNNKMVEYYVQHPNGRSYYVLMMAPRQEWNRYAGTFNSILQNLSFN
jgi:hypothetical protein